MFVKYFFSKQKLADSFRTVKTFDYKYHFDEKVVLTCLQFGTNIQENEATHRDLDRSEHSIFFDTFLCDCKLRRPTFKKICLEVVEISTGNTFSISNMTILPDTEKRSRLGTLAVRGPRSRSRFAVASRSTPNRDVSKTIESRWWFTFLSSKLKTYSFTRNVVGRNLAKRCCWNYKILRHLSQLKACFFEILNGKKKSIFVHKFKRMQYLLQNFILWTSSNEQN